MTYLGPELEGAVFPVGTVFPVEVVFPVREAVFP
jgi:hypothetical protein